MFKVGVLMGVTETYYLIRRDIGDKFTITKWDGGTLPLIEYRLNINDNNKMHCTCPSGKYRSYCHHTKMLRAWLKAGEPDEEIYVA